MGAIFVFEYLFVFLVLLGIFLSFLLSTPLSRLERLDSRADGAEVADSVKNASGRSGQQCRSQYVPSPRAEVCFDCSVAFSMQVYEPGWPREINFSYTDSHMAPSPDYLLRVLGLSDTARLERCASPARFEKVVQTHLGKFYRAAQALPWILRVSGSPSVPVIVELLSRS